MTDVSVRTDTDKIPPEIAEAVNKIMDAVGYIQKKGTNQFHNYKYAAIGDILAKIQPAMVEHGLIIFQDEISHEVILDNAVMAATYSFSLAHKSGAVWDTLLRHTGMAGCRNSKGGFDDKALNKCQTAARKYFLLALFQIPTGDVADPDEDDDATPHQQERRRPAGGQGTVHAPNASPDGGPNASPDGGIGINNPKPSNVTPGASKLAKDWGDGAILELAKVKGRVALETWTAENQERLNRLQNYDVELHKTIMDRLGILDAKYNGTPGP